MATQSHFYSNASPLRGISQKYGRVDLILTKSSLLTKNRRNVAISHGAHRSGFGIMGYSGVYGLVSDHT